MRKPPSHTTFTERERDKKRLREGEHSKVRDSKRKSLKTGIEYNKTSRTYNLIDRERESERVNMR